jgi:hypothetical protein
MLTTHLKLHNKMIKILNRITPLIIKSRIKNLILDEYSINAFIKYKYRRVIAEENNKLIYIAAMPKAAGTYISKILCRNLNYQYIHVGDRTGVCEFDIYLPNFIDNFVSKKNAIVHQHTPATKGNVEYLNAFNVKPVILLRDFFDVVYSMHRHLLKYKNVWPFFSYPNDFFNFSHERQLDFIIDYIMPWIIGFQQTWLDAIYTNKIKGLVISYHEFVENPEQTFNSILIWTNHKPINIWQFDRIQNARFVKDRKNVIDMNNIQRSRLQLLINYY